MNDYSYDKHRDGIHETVDNLITDISHGRVQDDEDLEDWLSTDADHKTTYLNRCLEILANSQYWNAIDSEGSGMPNNAAECVTLMAYHAWVAEVRDEFSRVEGQPKWEQCCPECDQQLEYDGIAGNWQCPDTDMHDYDLDEEDEDEDEEE